MKHVFRLNSALRTNPVVEDFADPVSCRFVDEVQYGRRSAVQFCQAFEEFTIENLPAGHFADEPGNLAAASPGFARDGQVRADLHGSTAVRRRSGMSLALTSEQPLLDLP